MSSQDQHDDVNDLIKALEESNTPIIQDALQPATLKEDNVKQYVIDSNVTLVNSLMEMLARLKGRVESAGEPRDIEAFSELTKTTVDALDNMNKLVLQKEKSDNALKLAQMKSQDSTQSLQGSTITQNVTNVIVGTREDIIKKILDQEKSKKDESVIDLTD